MHREILVSYVLASVGAGAGEVASSGPAHWDCSSSRDGAGVGQGQRWGGGVEGQGWGTGVAEGLASWGWGGEVEGLGHQ